MKKAPDEYRAHLLLAEFTLLDERMLDTSQRDRREKGDGKNDNQEDNDDFPASNKNLHKNWVYGMYIPWTKT